MERRSCNRRVTDDALVGVNVKHPFRLAALDASIGRKALTTIFPRARSMHQGLKFAPGARRLTSPTFPKELPRRRPPRSHAYAEDEVEATRRSSRDEPLAATPQFWGHGKFVAESGIDEVMLVPLAK